MSNWGRDCDLGKYYLCAICHFRKIFFPRSIRGQFYYLFSTSPRSPHKSRSEATKKQPREEDGRFTGHLSIDKPPEADKPKEHTHIEVAKKTQTSPATAGRALAMASDRMDLVEKVAQGEISFAEVKCPFWVIWLLNISY